MVLLGSNSAFIMHNLCMNADDDSPPTLDRIDRRILSVVQANNLTPHREIADKVGLSTPAVTRRLQRLRKSGLIQQDVSVLDAAALGRPLTIIAQVSLRSEQLADIDALRESFRRCPQVQHCYYVTGEADFILVLNVSDMAEYEELTRTLFFGSGNVKRFSTSVAMETVKAHSQVMLQGS